MSSIFQSSIGRKLIMSITGMCLVLFLIFHLSMNFVAAFSGSAYNAVCGFLGTNWYALAGTAVLALGFLLHIIYAFILTVRNRKARGTVRYAVEARNSKVEWSSQNMLVLGIIVLAGLGLHLAHFWYHMMWAELAGNEYEIGATDGTGWLQYYFSQIPVVICYLVWFVALWLHITHGFWSALQTIGANNLVWIDRLQKISAWVAGIIFAGFAVIVIGFALKVFPLFD